MTNQPNEPVQNYEIVNPTLEQQVRALLPSVAGYGGLLRSTNTVIPVVDVTTAAEGALLPESLQQALAFGSVTAFSLSGGAATTLANTPGFWRIFGLSSLYNSGGAPANDLSLTDGLSTKKILLHEQSGSQGTTVPFDFVIFLGSGESLTGQASSSARLAGNYRQIATADGTLVDPSGFPV